MKILVYEFVTGGGLWSQDSLGQFASPLLPEALAMVRAFCADLGRIADVNLFRLQDARVNSLIEPEATVLPVRSATHELDQLATWSTRVDGTILIAPEIDDQLGTRCALVQQNGGALLSPSAEFVRLAADKRQTASRLLRARVPTPLACHLTPAEPLPVDFPYPAVLKPNDGVGSLHTQLVRDPQDVVTALRPKGLTRLEQFRDGMPVSVASLCGRHGHFLLPACAQRMSADGGLRYCGGRLPLVDALAWRAQRLAQAALSAFPPTRGFVGVDMILGREADGRHDVILEINPRLTTSYVGLRRACQSNLAQAMLAIAQGNHYPLSFHSTPIRFDSDGQCVG